MQIFLCCVFCNGHIHTFIHTNLNKNILNLVLTILKCRCLGNECLYIRSTPNSTTRSVNSQAQMHTRCSQLLCVLHNFRVLPFGLLIASGNRAQCECYLCSKHQSLFTIFNTYVCICT